MGELRRARDAIDLFAEEFLADLRGSRRASRRDETRAAAVLAVGAVRRGDTAAMSEINVTPFVDVMLVLLSSSW